MGGSGNHPLALLQRVFDVLESVQARELRANFFFRDAVPAKEIEIVFQEILKRAPRDSVHLRGARVIAQDAVQVVKVRRLLFCGEEKHQVAEPREQPVAKAGGQARAKPTSKSEKVVGHWTSTCRTLRRVRCKARDGSASNLHKVAKCAKNWALC